MKISELDFLLLLPVFMRDDEAVIALSHSINKLMGNMRLDTLSTWDKIDELNDKECDELAWELDIDWYEPTALTLAEKRETIKLSQQIKRKRGTKWAVERVISMYLGDGGVEEWCDTAVPGTPYTFNVYTSNINVSDEMLDAFNKAVKIAKNERSHMISISHRHMLKDVADGKNYYLFVDKGNLILQSSYATAEGDTLYLQDRTAGGAYHLYVSGGELHIKATEAEGADAISFKDASTSIMHNIYIIDGQMMIEAV